ncbi:MAG: glycosyltransferase [Nitrososphaerales archaeon]
MRVLAVLIRTNADHEIGGSERSFVELGNHLVEQGMEVDVLEVAPPLSSRMASMLNHYVVDASGKLPFRFLRHTLCALRIARSRGCGVIFAPAVYWPETVFVALMASVATGKPLFIGIPGPFQEEEDRMSFFEVVMLRLNGQRAYKTMFATFLRKIALRSADGLLFATGEMAEDYKHRYGLKNAVAIGRGVDDLWYRAEDLPAAKDYDAIYVGRLDRGKGVETLIRAWASVGASIPGSRLLIVGAGSRAGEYRRLAEECKVGGLVRFEGFVKSPLEVRRRLRSSKLFVLPSEEEGFARAVSEAMASGTPCVVSDIPAMRELYGGAAVLVPPGDPAKLAESLVSLLLDEDARSDLSRLGVARAKRFTWKETADLTRRAFERASVSDPGERTPSTATPEVRREATAGLG